jgi:hypothetical protein
MESPSAIVLAELTIPQNGEKGKCREIAARNQADLLSS